MTRENTTQHDLHLGARTLHVTEQGAGETVVLLHGDSPGATGTSNYSRNINALAEHFHVLVPDMPGYGQSSKDLDQDDPFGDLAGAVLAMLDRLGIERAHLVGNSYGGRAALRLALDHPERVASLVLMGPGGIGTTRHLPSAGLRCLLGYYSGSGPSREKLEHFIREYLVADGSLVDDELVELRFQASIDPEVVGNPPLRRPGSLRAAWRMDLTRDRRLARCQVPTLVVWGTQDKVNLPDGGPVLAHTMPHCNLHLVSGAGHWVQWERADLSNRLAIDFINDHTAGALA